jgi:hypothetical protein
MRTPFEQIHYVVIHSTESAKTESPFQGYGLGLLETSVVFSSIARLPFDIHDFNESWGRILERRMQGDGCSVTPLQIDALATFLSFGFPFVCVCSPSHVAEEAARVITNAGRPIHHVIFPPIARAPQLVHTGTSIRLVEGATNANVREFDKALSMLSHDALLEHVTKTVSYLEGMGSAYLKAVSRLRESIGQPIASRTAIPLALPKRGHFVTAPTEAALEALGFSFSDEAAPPEGSDQKYAEAIADVSLPLIEARRDAKIRKPALEFLAPCDLIVAAPSLMAHWYESRNRRFGGPSGSASQLRMVANELAHQTGYAWHRLSDSARKALVSHEGVVLQWFRRMELRAFSCQLEVRAAADAVPVVRLPYGVNLSRVHALRLAQSSRRSASANQIRRINRFARALSESLTRATPPPIMSIIQTAGAKVKLVSDAPLEWMSVGAVPLMLHADCSRVPATPGNTSFAATIGSSEVILPLASFEDVLILRSFEATDPIRLFLEQTVSAFLKMAGSKMRVQIVDVSSLDEIREALNSFSGSMVVFDAHGGAGTTLSPGTIRIGKRDIDLRGLRGTVRVPPIAVLSACDTHAFDSSYATVAHSLLAAGATTVVGTTLPVDARYSSMFVARLLYRVDTYLPLDLRGPRGISRWSGVLPGLRRMNYLTEMLHRIDRKNGIRISEETHLKAGFVGNTYINGWDGAEQPMASVEIADDAMMSALYANALQEEIARGSQDLFIESRSAPSNAYPVWLAAVLRLIAVECGVPLDRVKQAVNEWAWITDALKYVELGNPERLLVVAKRDRP